MHPHLLRTNVIQWRCASCIETRITLSIQIVFKDLCMLFIAHHIFIAFFYELKFLPKLHLFFLLISLNIFTIQIFFTNSRLFPTFQNLFVTIVRKKSIFFRIDHYYLLKWISELKQIFRKKKSVPLRKHGSRNLLLRRKYIKSIRVKKMSATRAKLEDITWMLYKRAIIRSKRSLRTS